ncbi:MAG: hypothetical protein ABIJ52_09180 [Pseudomonadota bacterium]
MSSLTQVDKIIIDKLLDLPSNEKSEVLNFIEFVQIRKNQSFIDYVNERSKKAGNAIAAGEKLTSLKELQAEYGKKI